MIFTIAVTDKEKIDSIGIENSSNNLILTISDHLNWKEINEHLILLQNKLNLYLHFIESNQVNDYFTKNQYNTIVIKIVFKYNPVYEVLDFLRQVKGLMYDDVHLNWVVFETDNSEN